MSGAEHRRLAVALQYAGSGAPTVTAVGQGLIGERIVAAARQHGVPVEYDPALAQALSTVELDAEIPEALYLAVAEILGFLLQTSDLEQG